MSEPDRDDEVGVADVESVDAVECRRQRDRPDRVGLRCRLDPDDLQPDQGAHRNDLRERLDDVPAEAVRNGCESSCVRRRNATRSNDGIKRTRCPQPSAGRLCVGDVGVALRQAGEARTVSEADVEPVGFTLRRAQSSAPLHEIRIRLTSRRPGALAVLDSGCADRSGRPRGLRSPAREHADRDHAARADAEAAGGARVDQHFAWPGGIGEAAREHLRTVEGHAVPAVDVHQELDGLRPEEAYRPVLRVPGAVGKEAGDGRGLDIWTGSDLLDRHCRSCCRGRNCSWERRRREAVRDEVASSAELVRRAPAQP